MKKRNVLLICCSILLVLAGCEKKENANELHQGNETVQQESLNENDEAKEEPVEVNIYKINPDNEERVIEVKECEELNKIFFYYVSQGLPINGVFVFYCVEGQTNFFTPTGN